jgi:hypothetical protein
MDTVSRQEIMVAYLCVIGTVALVLLWPLLVSGRKRRGQSEPARAGQSEPARAVSAQSALTRTARDLWAPAARAVYVREPAFSRSAPALTGIGNGGRAARPSALRDAYARGTSLVQSAPSLRETSGLSTNASSARMRANAREAPATPGAPALPPSSARWRLENMGVGALEERCAENEREKDRRPREMTNVIGSDI